MHQLDLELQKLGVTIPVAMETDCITVEMRCAKTAHWRMQVKWSGSTCHLMNIIVLLSASMKMMSVTWNGPSRHPHHLNTIVPLNQATNKSPKDWMNPDLKIMKLHNQRSANISLIFCGMLTNDHSKWIACRLLILMMKRTMIWVAM